MAWLDGSHILCVRMIRAWLIGAVVVMVLLVCAAGGAAAWWESRSDLERTLADLRAQGIAPTWAEVVPPPRDEGHVALAEAIVAASERVPVTPEDATTAVAVAAWATAAGAELDALRAAVDALPVAPRFGGPRVFTSRFPWCEWRTAVVRLLWASRVADDPAADLQRLVHLVDAHPQATHIELTVSEHLRSLVLGAIAAAHRDGRTDARWLPVVRAWAVRPRQIATAALSDLRAVVDLYDRPAEEAASMARMQLGRRASDRLSPMLVRRGRAGLVRWMGAMAGELAVDPERAGPKTWTVWNQAAYGVSNRWSSWLEPDHELARHHFPSLTLIMDRETRGRLFAACVVAQLAGQAPPRDPWRRGGGPVEVLRIDGVPAGWYSVGDDGSDEGGSELHDWRMEVPSPLR